jgi:AhpD family alkylhydroperoxidase
MRLNFFTTAPETIAILSQTSKHLEHAFPDLLLKALVELRTSQINGCAYCVDLHSREARQRGETQQRLDCLCVWDDVAFFTPREKAALALAEAVTRVSLQHVPEPVFATAREHFAENELVVLVTIIAQMNLWNRLSITFENTPATAKQ